MNILDHKLHEAISIAKKTRDHAFASRSEHKIGASVITDTGEIFGGCNIESNISGLGMCAERAAINNAIVHGQYAFVALITYDTKPIIPCGACLQYVKEFEPLTQEIQVLTASDEDEITLHYLKDLLPKAYVSGRYQQKLQPYTKIVLTE